MSDLEGEKYPSIADQRVSESLDEWALYKAKFRVLVLTFLPNFKLKKGAVEIVFQISSIDPIVEQAQPTENGFDFSPGKSVIFLAKNENEISLEILAKVGKHVVGKVNFLNAMANFSAEDGGTRSLALKDNKNADVGFLEMQAIFCKIGQYEIVEENQDPPVCKKEGPTDVHKLIFRSNEEVPKLQVELIAPRRKQKPIIPPYHEDVAVQTNEEKPKKSGKTGKK